MASDEEEDSARMISFLDPPEESGPTDAFILPAIVKEEIVETVDMQHWKSKGEKEKGTFWPQRPTKADPSLTAAGVKANTVLTNLQRGNIPTMQTIVMEPVIASVHQRAGQGELRVREILDKKVINERDVRMKTPLMWASFYGQTPTVARLLQHGADVHAVADESETALHLAASSGHHDVVRTLLMHGAKPDSVDENSFTPLMFAALNNHAHSVNELLQHGANVALKNINNDTAISLAIKCNSHQAQAVLEQHILGMMKDSAEKCQSK